MSTTLAPAKELRPLLEARLSAGQVARLTQRSERTAKRWLAGETAPRGQAREQLVEIGSVLEELDRALPGAEPGPWLERRNAELDYRSPAELIGEGGSREVLAMLAALGEGAYL